MITRDTPAHAGRARLYNNNYASTWFYIERAETEVHSHQQAAGMTQPSCLGWGVAIECGLHAHGTKQGGLSSDSVGRGSSSTLISFNSLIGAAGGGWQHRWAFMPVQIAMYPPLMVRR